MHKKICLSKKISVFIMAIVVITVISIAASSSLLNRKAILQSKAAPVKRPSQLSDATEVTDPTKWPFMVRVSHTQSKDNTKKNYYCSGVLIAPYWVLTAAHCLVENAFISVDPVSSDTVAVKGGSPIFSNMKTFPLNKEKSIFIHPKYGKYLKKGNNSTSYALYDIALIKLDNSSNGLFKDIRNTPIKHPRLFGSPDILNLSILKNKVITEGEIAVVLGWGSTLTNSHMSEALNQAIMPLVSIKRTIKKWKEKYPEYENLELIAGFPNAGSRVCHGDSGGPLLINTQLDKNSTPIWAVYGITAYHSSNTNTLDSCGEKENISFFSKIDNSNENYSFIMNTLTAQDKPLIHFGPTLSADEMSYYEENICKSNAWNGVVPNRCKINSKTVSPRSTR